MRRYVKSITSCAARFPFLRCSLQAAADETVFVIGGRGGEHTAAAVALISSSGSQRRHSSGYQTYNKPNLNIGELRAKVVTQQRDAKAHVLDKLQTQVELAIQLAAQMEEESREEALGRGEALWATLDPKHALAPQIPAPTRTAVRVILSESMLDCARSLRDVTQTKVWSERHRNRGASLNPRDFDGPRQDPMAIFQFNESYGKSGVVKNEVLDGQGQSGRAQQMRAGGGGGGHSRMMQQQQRRRDFMLGDDDEDDLADDDDDDSFLDRDGVSPLGGSFLREKLRADGIDTRTLREERKAFDVEEAARRAEEAEEAQKGNRKRDDKEGRGSVTDHPDDDEKTRMAKEKLRKLFGDDNSTMSKHKQSVFNEHPLFTRGQKKWGEAVGPRYT